MNDPDSQDLAQETPVQDVFIPPSVHDQSIRNGESYTYHSSIPQNIAKDLSVECCLGVDEAGRGPVLGPMVYGLSYLPLPQHHSLLASTYHFDDSKMLTPAVRSRLMETLCSTETNLYQNCGWATRVMSATDISAGMLKPTGMYNLNAQAMDATIDLITNVLEKGINVREIYIDTIGSPQVYQKKLERIFPTISIVVAKKADSLYPCVSAASVCAKVTRDAALQRSYESYAKDTTSADGWGSGYPSDARCTTWLKENMHPLFGWGSECRFSWGTVKDLLEAKGTATRVDWPRLEENEHDARLTDFFPSAIGNKEDDQPSELTSWFGHPAAEDVF